MKKVALVVEATLGGIRQHVCDIAFCLPADEYQLYLIYSEKRADDAWEKEKENLRARENIELIECPEMQRELGVQDFAAYLHLKHIFNEIRPDIVHCHSSKAGIVGRMAAKVCKVPAILYTPNAYAFQMADISFLKRSIYIAAERFLSRYATTMTINVSEGERQQAFVNRLDEPDKFTLIYNGVPDKKLPPKQELRHCLGLPENAYYVGTTSRCAAQKDPMAFLDIARQTIERDSEIQFLYIGDGDLLPQMRTWVAKQSLEGKIHLLGFRSDAPEMVGALDVYLSTALYEGLPYSMLEAMRAGVPIIATDVVGNSEIVQNGQNGFLFPLQDTAAAVELLLRQKGTNMVEHEMVRETFQQKFSLDAMMTKLESVYDGIDICSAEWGGV